MCTRLCSLNASCFFWSSKVPFILLQGKRNVLACRWHIFLLTLGLAMFSFTLPCLTTTTSLIRTYTYVLGYPTLRLNSKTTLATYIQTSQVSALMLLYFLIFASIKYLCFSLSMCMYLWDWLCNWMIVILYTEGIQLRCSFRWSMFPAISPERKYNIHVYDTALWPIYPRDIILTSLVLVHAGYLFCNWHYLNNNY